MKNLFLKILYAPFHCIHVIFSYPKTSESIQIQTPVWGFLSRSLTKLSLAIFKIKVFHRNMFRTWSGLWRTRARWARVMTALCRRTTSTAGAHPPPSRHTTTTQVRLSSGVKVLRHLHRKKLMINLPAPCVVHFLSVWSFVKKVSSSDIILCWQMRSQLHRISPPGPWPRPMMVLVLM